MRLVSSKDIIEHVSGCAVRQHPFYAPEGLFYFVQDILFRCKSDFTDGVVSTPMKWFDSSSDIYAWLKQSFDGHPVLTVWNTPRSKHTSPIIGTSRYEEPAPEDDIIDIDALWLNVARGVWLAAAEFEKDKTPANDTDALDPTRDCSGSYTGSGSAY